MGGKKSEAKARNASAAKGRKTTKTKRPIAPAATRLKRRSVSGPSKDLKEAREQQAATAEILKVIASSPSDVQPVFEAIAERSNRLVNGLSTAVYSLVGDLVHLMAFTPVNPAADAVLQASFPAPLSQFRMTAVGEGETYTIVDPEIEFATQPAARELARLRGWRSLLGVPLLRDGKPIGLITVTRAEPGRFDDHHVQLLQTFADQAVIAIGNVRLFDEVQAQTRDLAESLEQQTATSEVLEVISASPGELEPVFQKMLENATRVCGANFGVMNLWNGEKFPNGCELQCAVAFAALRKDRVIRPHPESGLAIVVRTHQAVQIEDVRKSPAYLAGAPNVVEMSDVAGARSIIIVPMLKETELIGVITIYRQEVRPFTDKQIALVETFAKQAVIAIENTRLLKELRATHGRSERVASAADRYRRCAQGYQSLGIRYSSRAEDACRIRQPHCARPRMCKSSCATEIYTAL